MATKRDPRRQAVMCYTDIDILMKVKTKIHGRQVAIKSPKSVRQTSGTREMGFADFFIETVANAVKDVKPSREAKEWGRKVLEAKMDERKELDKIKDKDETRRQSTMRMKQYFSRKLTKAEGLLKTLKASKNITPEVKEKIKSEEERISKLRTYFDRYEKACEGFVDRRKKRS